MKQRKAFKYQLSPNGAQVRAMRQYAGNARKVWNLALHRQQEQHAAGWKYTNEFGMNEWLNEYKARYPYLAESPSQTLQQVNKNLHGAFKKFFNKEADYPKPKKKGKTGDRFRFPQGFEIDQNNSRIKLPKLGWIKYRNCREITGKAKNITLSCAGGRWYASIQTEQEMDIPLAKGGMVGIDLGVVRFATLSNGEVFEPLNSFKLHQTRLAKYQRQMAHKSKFSNNWKKAKAKVTQVHIDIGNARKDYLHKVSHSISKNHAVVCVEDLAVSNMSKSSKGNAEQPGSKVKQKSGLNRSILDQGWGEFRRQLDYKLTWNGGHLVAVPPHNTSRTCPCCEHVSKDNRQTQAEFACVVCGFEENADLVSAINVLRAGHARLACEVSGAVMPPAAGTHRSDFSLTQCQTEAQ
jgi:putative transposase